jgi:type IV secretion system protein VirB2
MEQQEIKKEQPVAPRKGDKVDKALDMTANALVMALIFLPQLAHAQDATSAFGGITTFLKSIANLLIFEWGYYIGIITLAIQGYRWKTGRIDLMALGGWGLGIGLVFFAPNIVTTIKSGAGSIA